MAACLIRTSKSELEEFINSVEIYKAQFIFTLFLLAKLAAPRSKGNLDLSKCVKRRYGLFEGSSNSDSFV